MRRHNLSLVLNLVHSLRSVSRAELTRRTSLNRSTIAALVAELVQLGLVLETEPDATNQVGRPSLLIVPDERVIAIAVYPELDAVTIGLVGFGQRVVRTVRYDNTRIPTAREVVNVVAAVVAGMREELETRFTVVGIGIAVPGLVGASDGIVAIAPHLGWRDEPLADMMGAATGYEVWASNDASTGAIAESKFGSGAGVGDMIYLNGGASGIGGGVVSGGVLLRGASGFAGELGHTLVNSAGVRCHCGATGCLETEVRRAPLLAVLGLGHDEADRLDGTLTAAFASGGTASPELRDLVESQLAHLGIALAQFTNIFNPALIVLGGFLGSLFTVSDGRLAASVRERGIVGSRDTVTITRSTLGPDLLMIGAAELALAHVLADPAALLTTPRSA